MRIKAILISAIGLLAMQTGRASAHDGVMPRIDGQPALLLAGELGNSSAACTQDIDSIFPHLRAIGCPGTAAPPMAASGPKAAEW